MKEINNKKIILIVCISLLLILLIFFGIILINNKKGDIQSNSFVNNNINDNIQIKEENITEDDISEINNTLSEDSNYTCPDGYTLSDSICVKTEIISVITNKFCELGELDGDYCYIAVQPAQSGCKEGYSYSVVTELCQNNNDPDDVYAPTEATDCSYTGSDAPFYFNGMCNIREDANITYSCPDGYTLSDSTCVKTEIINAIK